MSEKVVMRLLKEVYGRLGPEGQAANAQAPSVQDIREMAQAMQEGRWQAANVPLRGGWRAQLNALREYEASARSVGLGQVRPGWRSRVSPRKGTRRFSGRKRRVTRAGSMPWMRGSSSGARRATRRRPSGRKRSGAW